MQGRARVSWNLRRIRTERQVSQESLAVDAGVDRTYISGIENDGFAVTVDVLDKLAAALEVDIAEFLVVPKESQSRPQPLRPGRRKSR